MEKLLELPTGFFLAINSEKKMKTRTPTYCATKAQVTYRKKQAQDFQVSRLKCDDFNIYEGRPESNYTYYFLHKWQH